EMLGRMPQIGKSACEIIGWRAENIGHCVEVAAAYETCGKDAAMRQRLQTRCPADWGQLVRYSLRSAMAGTMKTKKCSEFKKVVAQFESEPATATLSEFSEIQSLTQYTCALEA